MKEIIEFFNEKDVFVVEHENGKRYMKALDVAKIMGYKNPSVQIMHVMNRHPQLYASATRLVTETAIGKREAYFWDIDCVIAFCMKSDAKKAIPFQKWAVGVLRAEIEKLEKVNAQEIRLKSKETRNFFTGVLSDHGISKPSEYVQLTYAVKEGVGIDKDKKKENFDLKDFLKVTMAESLSTYRIIEKDPNGFDEVKPVVSESSKEIGILTSKRLE